MRKIFTFIIILIYFQNTEAQEVSPYYPTPFTSTTNNQYETQITYFDLNFVNIKIQDFMSYKMNMTIEDSKYELKDGKGFITEIFIDKIAINKEPDKLFFKYNVFSLEDDLVVKSLKITGDPDKVLKFYVSFWSTNLNFDDVSKNEIVSNRFFQDRISYSYNNGKSYIEVSNETIKNIENFKQEYLSKKAELNKEKQQLAEKEEIKQKKKEEESAKKQNTDIKTFTYQVVKKKNRLKIEEKNGYFKDIYAKDIHLEKELTEYLKDKKQGTYIIDVEYTIIYDSLTKTDFKIRDFKKPRGFLDAVQDVIEY